MDGRLQPGFLPLGPGEAPTFKQSSLLSSVCRADEGVPAGHRARRQRLPLHRLQAQEWPFRRDHGCFNQRNHGEGMVPAALWQIRSAEQKARQRPSARTDGRISLQSRAATACSTSARTPSRDSTAFTFTRSSFLSATKTPSRSSKQRRPQQNPSANLYERLNGLKISRFQSKSLQ